MNNDDNNIELPKRIDEIPNPTEPNNESNEVIQPNLEETVNFDNINNQNPAFGENQEVEQPVEQPMLQPETQPQLQQETQANNVFEQPEINPQPSSSPFEPIPNLDVFSEDTIVAPEGQEEIQNIITPEHPENVIINNDNQLTDNIVNLETPTADPLPENKSLNKKVVVEEPIQKEKGKGNPIVGFFVLLIILAIILAAFYYFIKIDFIKLPDNIKNKIPFLTTTTTTQVNQKEDAVNIAGEYLEAESVICPDVPVELKLKADNTFSYTKLTYKEAENKCDSTEITGNYIAKNGKLRLIKSDDLDNVISGTYEKTPVTFEIKIPTEDNKVIILYGKGE